MADLLALIDAFKNLNVLVIGDAMLDSYLHGSSDRLCPEAPVPVVAVRDRIDQPGGAANTALNVHSLAGNVTFLSVIGEDLEANLLRNSLEARGVSTHHLLAAPSRRTLAKHRVMANGHLLLRFDQGTTAPLEPELESQLIERLTELISHCDALIISDYSYGILTPRIIQTLALLQTRHPRTLVVDAKHLTAYQHVKATAVKPNYSQTLALLGSAETPNDRIQHLATQGDRILELTGAAIAAVTLDTDGALIFEQGQPIYRTSAQPTSHVQATGAGDTYVSALTLALAAAASTPAAAELAAAAAAIVVAKAGTAVCEVSELRNLVRARSRLGNLYTVAEHHAYRSADVVHDDSVRGTA